MHQYCGAPAHMQVLLTVLTKSSLQSRLELVSESTGQPTLVLQLSSTGDLYKESPEPHEHDFMYSLVQMHHAAIIWIYTSNSNATLHLAKDLSTVPRYILCICTDMSRQSCAPVQRALCLVATTGV